MQLSSPPTEEWDAAWREKSARLDRTIETLERISAALCITPDEPGALCRAVVDAAGHHFSARWAAMTFADGPLTHELPDAIVRGEAPAELHALAARAVAARGPVVAGAGVAVPMVLRDELAGALAVGLPAGVRIDESDLSILLTLANHAGVALHNARRHRQLERARQRLEDVRRRQLLGQERNRIARELHDSVAQHLLSIGMMLEWCRKQEPSSSPSAERLVSSKELARSALEEIRAVIYELSTAEHQDSLPAALDELVEELTHTTDLEIALRSRGRPRALAPDAEHALAQIAREALFNVARHAEASRAWLTVRYGDRYVGVTVADNGRGDPERLERRLQRAARGGSNYHRGLTNIAERGRGLGARIHFAPRHGGGVRLEVTAPLQ